MNKKISKNVGMIPLFGVTSKNLKSESPMRFVKPNTLYALLSVKSDQKNLFLSFNRSVRGEDIPKGGVDEQYFVIVQELVWLGKSYSQSFAQMWYELFLSCDTSYDIIEEKYGSFHIEKFYEYKLHMKEKDIIEKMKEVLKTPQLKKVI